MTRNAISVPADIMWKGQQSAVPAIFQNSLFYGCREATAFMKYHKGSPLAESCKEGSVYGRIPYEPGFLMILQVAKRIGMSVLHQRSCLWKISSHLSFG